MRQTLKPILLYGCEIWGYFNQFTSRFRNGNIPIDQFFSKLHCEKLHLKFCKVLLGVHKKSKLILVCMRYFILIEISYFIRGDNL